MSKRLLAVLAVAAATVLAARRVQAERAEADLWREATDDPAAA